MSASSKDSLLVKMHCLFMLPMFVGVLCLFRARTLYRYRCIFIGASNVCRGFVSVSCKDYLLV